MEIFFPYNKDIWLKILYDSIFIKLLNISLQFYPFWKKSQEDKKIRDEWEEADD